MKLLTAREVARLLRVRIETVYRYARQGRIPRIRVGGGWRFSEELLQAWMRNGERQSSPNLAPKDDPLLKVIGIGSDGRLARGIDRSVYGRR